MFSKLRPLSTLGGLRYCWAQFKTVCSRIDEVAKLSFIVQLESDVLEDVLVFLDGSRSETISQSFESIFNQQVTVCPSHLLLRHIIITGKSVPQRPKYSRNGQPSGHVQESAHPYAARDHVVPLRWVPEDVGIEAAIGCVDVAVVGKRDRDQVPLGRGAAGREAAYDCHGRQQEEHVAELQGDRQRLPWEVLLLAEGVRWKLVGVVLERVIPVYDICPNTEALR